MPHTLYGLNALASHAWLTGDGERLQARGREQAVPCGGVQRPAQVQEETRGRPLWGVRGGGDQAQPARYGSVRGWSWVGSVCGARYGRVCG